jgi:cysteine-rich repeat protein
MQSVRQPAFSVALGLVCLSFAPPLGCGGDDDLGGGSAETETTGDGDDNPTTTGDGDPTTTGDGDGDPAECGNGVVEPGEACDDGNAIDDDGCTNACTLPACGDGIVQADAGEVCDDGNTLAGDACTSTCQLPGAVIAEVYLDVGDMSDDLGRQVVIDSHDNIAVLTQVAGPYRLLEVDAELELVWNVDAPASQNPSLAIGPDDRLAVGGRNNMQGVTRVYDSDGNPLWTSTLAGADSNVYSVAFDDAGHVLAGGFQPGGNGQDGVIVRYAPEGGLQWTRISGGGFGYGALASAGEQLWAVRGSPFQVESYGLDQAPIWTSPELPPAIPRELAVDEQGQVHALLAADDGSSFSVTKLSTDGQTVLWTRSYDNEGQSDTASGLAVVPAGGVIVAGMTDFMNGGDAVLVWIDTNGEIIHELILDSPADIDLDQFYDVAVDAEGEYAVAVGGHAVVGGSIDLWIYKFEI